MGFLVGSPDYIGTCPRSVKEQLLQLCREETMKFEPPAINGTPPGLSARARTENLPPRPSSCEGLPAEKVRPKTCPEPRNRVPTTASVSPAARPGHVLGLSPAAPASDSYPLRVRRVTGRQSTC